MGRHEEAIAEAERAQQLDPLSLIINTDVGWHYYFARQYDTAIEQLSQALDLDHSFTPAYLFLGQAYVQKEMYQEAFTALNKAVSLSGAGPRYVAVLGYTYAVSGKRGEAQKVLDELSELSKRRYVQPFDLALIYTGIGEEDQAFAWLEKAYEEHSGWLMFIKVEP